MLELRFSQNKGTHFFLKPAWPVHPFVRYRGLTSVPPSIAPPPRHEYIPLAPMGTEDTPPASPRDRYQQPTAYRTSNRADRNRQRARALSSPCVLLFLYI